MPPEPPTYHLTESQKSHFLDYGYVKIPNCFSRSTSAEWTADLWTRLGYSADDKSTWARERIHMPTHQSRSVATFAPKAWSAICELLGGEDRIHPSTRSWRDNFIVNLGKPEYSPDEKLDFRMLDNWHTDGDFFVHFLDSGEQALLVVPLFSDIVPRGGGTVVSTDGIGVLARYLYEHPEGVLPSMKPVSGPGSAATDDFNFWRTLVRPAVARPETFHEMTGEIGDVFLLHPLMLHSASRNLLRHVRVITNPPISLKEPFNLSRKGEDVENYSLVELKTLKELGMPEGAGEWKITGVRGKHTPERLKQQEEMKKLELARLENKS